MCMISMSSSLACIIWEDNVVFDLIKHSEQKISTNQMSVETLVFFWKFWKDKIVNIIEYLRCSKTQDVNEYGDFCLNYFGVRKQFHNDNAIYLLLNSDADWVRELDKKFLHRNGKLVSIDVHQFVSTARSYWCSELLSVGMKVLGNLEALYNISLKSSLSTFCQSISLTHIYEIAKFLKESKYLDIKYHTDNALSRYVELSTNIFGYIFPLDWRKSLAENMFSLRGTDVSKNLLKQVIRKNISPKVNLTYGQIGRVVMIILGLGKLNNDLYEEILKRFDGNAPWKIFIQTLCGNMASKLPHATRPDNGSESPRVLSLPWTLYEALVDAYSADWKTERDYISPDCFLYLVERLLMLASCSQGYFITSMSSFTEWFIYQEEDTNPDSTSVAKVQPLLRRVCDFVVNVVKNLLDNKVGTLEWIKKSRIYAKDYYPLLLLRLVSILCLVHLNHGNYSDLLIHLLRRSYIYEQLPWEFYDVLRRRHQQRNFHINVLAEAFKKINNPLVIVSLRKNCSQYQCPDAIFVDMTIKQRREDMLRVLFPKTVKAMQGQTGIIEAEASSSCSEVLSSGSYSQDCCKLAPSNCALNNINGSKLPMNYGYFWEMFEALKSLENGGDPKSFLSNARAMKVDVDKSIHLATTVTSESLQNTSYHEDENLLHEVASMLDELKLLSAALDVSEPELGNSMSTIGELSKRLQSRRPKVEPILGRLFLQHGKTLLVETSVEQDDEKEDSGSKAKIDTGADKGKSKELEADFVSGDNKKNSQETATGNKGKGNKPRKKKGKGGRRK